MTYPFVITAAPAEPLRLPEMRMVRQRLDVPPAVDVAAEFERSWAEVRGRLPVPVGGRVAVCVGSRGITGLVPLVGAVVARLRAAGCRPFVTPAMGSHGGGVAEGQLEVLATLGITEEGVGAPVEATMDVVSLGEEDGIPLYLDRLASQADGIVLVNRVKPHTDFVGPIESGLTKMIVIGLGNRAGAEHYHRSAVVRGFGEMLLTAGGALRGRIRLVCGVALVENQEHEPAIVRVVPPDELEPAERELLVTARGYLPHLPVDPIDLLIVDEMGKNVSGSGLDPNVTGRVLCPWMSPREHPAIARIIVRGLTAESEGNACGLGQVDCAAVRLIDQIDFQVTAVNDITSMCPEDGKIPLTFADERSAVAAALATIRPHGPGDLRLVYIRNTLQVTTLAVSEGCLPDLAGRDDVVVEPGGFRLAFAADGYLESPFAAVG